MDNDMENQIIMFCLIIIAMAFANMCGTLYFSSLEKKKANTAAFWSAMLILANAFTITNYVENNAYIAAAFIGTYLGTFATLKWKQKNDEH
jgi:predicted MFS family arabinose efflux permease